MNPKIAIVIQARSNSTRLPSKVLLPFYNEESILEIILKRLKKVNIPVVVATSTNELDNEIEKIVIKNNCICFRGDEENVISRFVNISNKLKLDFLIRICADNPFINIEMINELITEMNEDKSYDYISHYINKHIPSIKSHYGIFCELISSKALNRITMETNDSRYLEHVTNYIYENENVFKIKKIDIPKYLKNNKNLRFTVDDLLDFEIMSKIYQELGENTQSINLLSDLVKNNNYIKKNMKFNIKNYSK